MKAAVIHSFDQSPTYTDFAEPTPNQDEIIVQVLAAGLHPVVKMLASGTHYGSTDTLPMIPGIDGIGRTADGKRVYFGNIRAPYGTLAEHAAVNQRMCMPIPDSLDDITAAAIFNPGLSAWLSLKWRAQLTPGETVLILGATGAAGQLAVQIAKHLGAGKVIAVGRNPHILDQLTHLGADEIISLDQPEPAFIQAIAHHAQTTGINSIIDYLWGRPTEMLIEAITQKGLTHTAPRTRLIEVGQKAGATINLPASVLRSSNLEIYGSGAGTVPIEAIIETIPQFIQQAATGNLTIATEQLPLSDITHAWNYQAPDNRRIILIP